MTVVLWIGMLATVAWIVAAGFAHFDARRAFDFPPHAFTITPAFMAGTGRRDADRDVQLSGLLRHLLRRRRGTPGRSAPSRAPSCISVLAVGAMFALMTLAIMGVVPWREAAQSKFVAARFMETLYGPGRAAR